MITARLSIVPDCHLIAPRMREADKIEVKANGLNPFNALFLGYVHSSICYTVVDEHNTPHAMFGCCELPDSLNIASIWLLGTDDIFKHRVRFLKESKKYLNIISKSYDMTFNYVHVDNTLHIRWLKWLGFTFLREVSKHGVNGENFYEFARIK